MTTKYEPISTPGWIVEFKLPEVLYWEESSDNKK